MALSAPQGITAAPNFRLRLVLAAAIALAGGLIAALGFRALKQARTTVSPFNIGATSALVTQGIYRYTRNPTYVGLLFLLVALTLVLGQLVAALGPVAFVVFINRFQISPEEVQLQRLFGDSYSAYCAKVRRWL